MTRKVSPARASSKSTRFASVQSNAASVQTISPVMARVRDLLKGKKPAVELHLLTDLSISYCEKLLCGQRALTADVQARLLCIEEHDIGQEVLLAIGEGRKVGYIQSVRVRADLRLMEQQLAAAASSVADMRRKAVEA